MGPAGLRLPEFVSQAGTFTDLGDLTPTPLIDTSEFYTRRGISPENEVIDLPDQLESLLDAFFDLPPDEAQRFLHCCFWLNHAKQVGPLARSAAHLAVVQAIEALLPEQEDAGNCETCGRQLGPGPTARFDQFLRDFVPSAEAEQQRANKELYRLRSALSHGGKLLQDELSERGMGLHPSRMNEDALLGRARLVAQLAAVNWLRGQARARE
jgi:hypothetical protein